MLFVIALMATMNLAVFGASGDVDLSFNASAYGNINGNVFVIKEQADGKFLAGGIFTEVNGFARSGLVRFNADRTVDETFYPPDLFSSAGIGSTIYALGIQSDGKIIVGGNLLGVDGVFAPGLKRLNADGSLDTSFNAPQINNVHSILDIEILSNDKILIGGQFQLTASGIANLARLNADGSIDDIFTAGFNADKVNDIEVQPDGKLLIAGVFSGVNAVRRYEENGRSQDGRFAQARANEAIETVKLQQDGKILIGGHFTSINNVEQGYIARLNSNGTLDTDFNINNAEADGFINDIDIRANGKIVIGGGFTSYNTTPRQRLAQLNADGSLDDAFQNNNVLATTVVNDVEILSGGRLLVGTNYDVAASPLLSFDASGAFDVSFAPYIARIGRVREVVQQADGKILIGGEFPFVNGVARKSLARLNADGSLDATFVPYFTSAQTINAIAVQPDGKILIGAVNGITLRRLNADGSLDATFAPNLDASSSINDIIVLANGQILVAGHIVDGEQVIRRLAVFNQNGSINPVFDLLQPNNTVNKILQQPDGDILVAGDFTQIGSVTRNRIARLTDEGRLDTSFNPLGGANEAILDFDLQADGKIVLGGDFTTLNGSADQQRIGRLNSDGSLDAAFVQQVDESVLAVKVQPDGRILLGGSFNFVQGEARENIARLYANGRLDTAFNASANFPVWDVNLQNDGRILLGGSFTKVNGISRLRVVRLLNTLVRRSVLFDYDGDERADVSVYRPSTNRWYEYFVSTSTVAEQTFGAEGDIIAPADFDGDGKTDIAIFRPSSGDWWYLSSVDNTQKSVHWGQAGDVPLPGDYDGD
ncbi:MAG: hypothetical protein JWN60_1070, partial [Acidobacteria bacterium]|nr:hypothetical protein [Acidobacteriota bacterium]